MFHGSKFDDIGQSVNQSDLCDGSGIVTRRNLFQRMLTLVAALPMSGIPGTRAFAAAIDPEAGRGFYKIVSYEVPPEGWQDFLAMCKVNAEASLKEPGVTGFEVLLSRGAANTVIAVEAYRDEDASKAHQQTAHFHTFVEGAQRLGVKRTVVEATRYYPEVKVVSPSADSPALRKNSPESVFGAG
jgi:quinol monooxygenase YgiN